MFAVINTAGLHGRVRPKICFLSGIREAGLVFTMLCPPTQAGFMSASSIVYVCQRIFEKKS